MKLAIIGDRGIPAKYSGFSTLVEQLATRLVAEYDFEVTVYCRSNYYPAKKPTFEGVDCVYLPAPGGKNFESIIHTNLAISHVAFRSFDVVFVLDPGNSPFVLPLNLMGIPVIMHTDGMGWKRNKWSPLQKKYYKWSEKVMAGVSDWLVTDSKAMKEYYLSEYNVQSTFIPYSGAVGDGIDTCVLREFGLEKNDYYICVARIEPDNNIDIIIREYRKANVKKPLVVVGNARYDSEYGRAIMAENDRNVRCIGAVWNKNKLNALLHHSYVYLHGHEVGGTNPSLLTAMHMSAAPVCMDVVFHREVMGDGGRYFSKEDGMLASVIQNLDKNNVEVSQLSTLAKTRSDKYYRWDAVADAYAQMIKIVKEHWKDQQMLRKQLEHDIYPIIQNH